MKKILISLLFIVSVATAFGQYPTPYGNLGSVATATNNKGGMFVQGAFVPPQFADTTAANSSAYAKRYAGSVINTTSDNLYWYRSYDLSTWLPFGTGGGGGGTIRDTIYTELPLYVDTITEPGKRILKIYHADGLVSGGIVTWSGIGLTYNVTSATYYINSQQYVSPSQQVTLAPADPTYSTQYLFVVDTTSSVVSLRGSPAPLPLAPQIDPASQVALTSGITINAGDTIPTNITLKVIYNENVEWTAGKQGSSSVVDFSNSGNPYRGAISEFISSYHNGAVLTYVDTARNSVSSGEILSFYLYSNSTFDNNIYATFYDTLTRVSNTVLVTNSAYGFSRTNSYTYQNISVPLSAFTWTGSGKFTRLNLTLSGSDTSGAKGFYLDYLTLQSGLNNIPPPSAQNDSAYIDITVSSDSTKLYARRINGSVDTLNWSGSGGGGLGVSLQQAFDRSLAVGDNPAINAHSQNLTIDSLKSFSLISPHSDGGKSRFLMLEDEDMILDYRTDTASVSLNLLASEYVTRGAGAELAIDVNNINTGHRSSLVMSPDYVEFANGRDDGRFRRKLKIGIRNIDTLLAPPPYIAAFDGDTLKKVAYPTGGGGVGGISKLGSPTFGLIRPNDSTYVADTINGLTSKLRGDSLAVAINTKQNSLNGTGYVRLNGTSLSYVTSPKDSSAYHNIVIVGDSLLVWTDLNGRGDTVSLKSIQLWKQNGNKIYYNGGNVGIGTDTPFAKLVVRKDGLGNVANSISDSTGVMLFNSTKATSNSTYQSSPPLTFRSNGWNVSSSSSYDTRMRFRGQATTSAVLLPPAVIMEGSTDGGFTYTTYITFSVNGISYGGNNFADNTHTTNIALLSTANLTTTNLTSTGYVANFGGGTYPDDAGMLITSANRGLIPPRLTTKQRDSINLTIGSITVTAPGTGYTTAPTVNIPTTKVAYQTGSATATSTLSGSTVGSITVTKAGSYNGIPPITLTGGGGSGATAVANMVQVLTPGNTIYCTDCIATDTSTGVMQTWNGSSWKNNW